MFREQYQQLHAQAGPSRELVQNVIEKARKYERRRSSRRWILLKPAAAAACICACLYFAMPVLAASCEPVYQLMYRISPAVAQHFMPVQKSDTSHGIQMEVVSAYIHGNTAEIYITMQDLEGDRIDKTIDLYDSYSIHRPFDSTCHCELAGYDERTKTASFLITVQQWGEKEIAGEKITFSVKNFLSRKENYQDVEIPVNLTDVLQKKAKTQMVSSAFSKSRAYGEEEETPYLIVGASGQDEEEISKLLEQDAEVLDTADLKQSWELVADGIGLAGIGYVNGQLHIQRAVRNPLSNDNHGNFYLTDRKGRRLDSRYSLTFTSDTSGGPERIDYTEEVFDIAEEELADCTLYGDFTVSGMLTEGDWRVTFPLEE